MVYMKKRTPRPTVKQMKAVSYIVKDNMKPTRAMIKAGYSLVTANSPGTNLLTKPSVENMIAQALKKQGLTPDRIAEVHNKLLDSQDESIQMKAVDVGYKVHGAYDTHTTRNTFNAPVMIQITPPKDPHMALHSDIIDKQ